MKIINKILLTAIVCLSTYSVTQSMQPVNVKLVSSDEKEFEVPRNVAEKSITVKNLIEDLGMQEPIPLPKVQDEVLKFILDLLREDLTNQELISGKINNKIKELSKSNPRFGYDFFAAVNYLDIPDLLPVAINSVAQLIDSQIKENKKDDLKYGLELIPKGGPLENQIRQLIADNSILLFNKLIGLKKIFDSFAINSVAFSPVMGKYILTASNDTAKLWDTNTGKLIHTFVGDRFSIISAAFSPDEQYILTGSSNDKTAKLWNIKTGKLIYTFDHTNFIPSVAFSPDGKYILTGSWDKTAKLWDTKTGNLIRTFTHTFPVNSVIFSPDGKHILTGSGETAKLWNSNTGSLIRTFSDTDTVNSVSFSPDGKYILTGSGETAKLWNTNTSNLIRTFTGHADLVKSVAFSPDGKYILSGSNDKTAKLWNATTGNLIHTFTDHSDIINSVAFSPDGKYILTGSNDKTARIRNIFILESLNLESIVFVLLFKTLKIKGQEQSPLQDPYWNKIFIDLPESIKEKLKSI